MLLLLLLRGWRLVMLLLIRWIVGIMLLSAEIIFVAVVVVASPVIVVVSPAVILPAIDRWVAAFFSAQIFIIGRFRLPRASHVVGTSIRHVTQIFVIGILHGATSPSVE